MGRDGASVLLVTVAFVLLLGCFEDCPDCDDGNICTFDYCEKGRCSHVPLNGPDEGCYGTGGCLSYTCLNGSCVPQQKSECCGNSVCDGSESYSTCPRDCRATCFDGVRNQGESGVDCGSPCDPCEEEELNYLRKISSYQDEWFNTTVRYDNAIRAYNRRFDVDDIRNRTFEIYSAVSGIQRRVNSTKPPAGLEGLHQMFGNTIELYLKSLDSMILYTATKNSSMLYSANSYMDDSIANDRRFVLLFNEYVKKYNRVMVGCYNNVLDEGEERIDCGGVCKRGCVDMVSVTKVVTVESSGYGVDITLNVTPPAIDYPPYHRVVNTDFAPQPEYTVTDGEGNIGYVYRINFKGRGVAELKINQLLELKRGIGPAAAGLDPGQPAHSLKNPPLEEEALCPAAASIKGGSTNVKQTEEKIYGWLNDNVKYASDEIEHGGLYAYTTREGACDEHADLAISFNRCLGIPARRVVGYLINSSGVNGHAWLEYYDGGWVYYDPSAKGGFSGFVTDGRHIISCVGIKAYNCGTTYSYTYMPGRKPEVTLKEDTYLG